MRRLTNDPGWSGNVIFCVKLDRNLATELCALTRSAASRTRRVPRAWGMQKKSTQRVALPKKKEKKPRVARLGVYFRH